ncbi:MAG: hypothetical protein E4H36_02795 [Spirochaetales bacterium]|nr:MAG: hypothetical protein E4H36_02795 [Spirochaetales bacterium]
MFWKEPAGLKSLNVSAKVGITLFLIIAGIGYLLGFANILLTYSPVVQKPGMSMEDIRISFYGARGTTVLEASIDGTMKEYFQSENEYQELKLWLTNGASEADFASVQPVFESSCVMCHSSESEVAGVVTESYQSVEPLLAQDTGKSISRLVALSHTHVLATLPIIFLLALVFSFTLYNEKLKAVVIGFSFLAILFDIGSWWLAKAAAGAAPLVILGGVSLAVSFGAYVVLSLIDLLFKKKKA